MKRILGSLIAVGAMVLMAVGVQAATYSAGSVAAADGSAVVPVIVTPDSDETASVNGYVVTFTYDGTKVSPVASATTDETGADCYATVDDDFASGVLVSDVVSGEDTSEEVLAVAWASADAISVTEAAYMATVEFAVEDDVTDDVAIAVEVVALTSDGTSVDDSSTYTVASGEITLSSSVLLGDVNTDGSVTVYDASLVAQYAADLLTSSELDLSAAEVSGDGSVTVYDASLIAQYAADILDIFPAES